MTESKIKNNNIERFNLTNSSGFSDFVGYGEYDNNTRTVRIFLSVYHASKISSAILARIPLKYRPSTITRIPAVIGTGIGTDGPIFCHGAQIKTDGYIYQEVSGETRQATIIANYYI